MANDVSYFKIPGDSTQYSFNDVDAESDIDTLNSNIEKSNRFADFYLNNSSNTNLSFVAGGQNRLSIVVRALFGSDNVVMAVYPVTSLSAMTTTLTVLTGTAVVGALTYVAVGIAKTDSGYRLKVDNQSSSLGAAYTVELGGGAYFV